MIDFPLDLKRDGAINFVEGSVRDQVLEETRLRRLVAPEPTGEYTIWPAENETVKTVLGSVIKSAQSGDKSSSPELAARKTSS